MHVNFILEFMANPNIYFFFHSTESCIRLALRQCGITTICSFRDHAREAIAYLRQYGCHGILAQSSEFAIFDPPLLFSSHLMKLTKKGELLSVQYNMDEVAKAIDLNPERMVIFAALLGKVNEGICKELCGY